MGSTDFQSLYQLIFNAGLVICFGLGVISGGQR
ncbi:TPA: tail virion protein G7P-2 [Klebsiella pneumoniae]|nr:MULTISPECIES: tail virion protein G7P-2 [Enterobacteriaceae]MCS5768896.1 tail virion protein G7P-2 [Klebsiella pneumoniae subsp. pneumoniae]MCS5768906.1 tail virion protein G7P-2 [Klebsiella pneumoniae subsp. pneumoniae]MCS5768916.1 tail virion protein G7P-2 [Klebsiella pneumoniae subsp. pneumoniae]DAG09235.1 MAG TPA: minor coat protein [Inoviridae sp.]